MSAEAPVGPIGFVGAGAVGTGLALALDRLGFSVTAVSSRRQSSAAALADQIAGCQSFDNPQSVADGCELVFITTPDSAIATVAESVRWRPGQSVVHCCGTSGPEILAPADAQGAITGAFHPFQTFAGISGTDEAVARLTGVTFAVSAQGNLLDTLQVLAAALGGRVVSIPDGARPLYHAAAIMSCGYLVTLLHTAAEVLQSAGFTEAQAQDAITGLAKTTVSNLARSGAPASLSGPLVRGDVATVEGHMATLDRVHPPAARLYAELTELSLPLAQGLGLEPAGARRLIEARARLGLKQLSRESQDTR